MAYERMTLSSFSEHLKAGKYDTATGARRAVGKATDWSGHDKTLAANAINTHFGADAPKTAPRAAKKSAKAIKKVAKVAKKAAAKAAPAAAAPKQAAKAAPVKRAVSKRTPTPKAYATSPAPATELTDSSFMLPVRTVTTPALIGEAVLRQNNASNVVVALSALQSRDAQEQLLYTRAMAYASESFAAPVVPTAAAPKPFVSLREQMGATPVPPASAPGARPDQKDIDQVTATARGLVGPSYGTTSNAVPPAQPLG
jgi:hypothetical protein